MHYTNASQSGSVAILMVLRPKDSRNERYVILTEQARPGAHNAASTKIPTGNLDHRTGDIVGRAVQEIVDKTRLKIRREDTIDMTVMALEHPQHKMHLPPATYIRPTTSDEPVSFLLWEKDLDRKEIEDLKAKFSGERAGGGQTIVRVYHYEAFWREVSRDATNLAAWELYESLNRLGMIGKRLHEIRTEQAQK